MTNTLGNPKVGFHRGFSMVAVRTPVSKPASSGPSSIIPASSLFWSGVSRDCLPGYGPLTRARIPEWRYCSIHYSRLRSGTPNISATSFWRWPSLTRRMQLVLRNRSTSSLIRAMSHSSSSISRSSGVNNNPFISAHGLSCDFLCKITPLFAFQNVMMPSARFKSPYYNIFRASVRVNCGYFD